MKKYVNTCFIIVLCILISFFTSCEKKEDESEISDTFYDGKEDESEMSNTFYGEYVIDDLKTLECNLTKEYDLNELKSFFRGSKANESIGFGSTISPLLFSEVNYRYPVEILRTGGYSVYRVSQGGYFYVFWIEPFTTGTSQSNREPSVYFSAYLSSDISPDLFDSLTPGISTAEDVQRIDPSFELSFLISNGIFSYSYINDETILQIEYEYQENIDGYDDLIVKEKMIVARDSAPTRYSALLLSDLP